MAESYVEVESVLLMYALEESAINVAALFKVCIGFLPVEIPWEARCHGINKIKLLVDEGE